LNAPQTVRDGLAFGKYTNRKVFVFTTVTAAIFVLAVGILYPNVAITQEGGGQERQPPTVEVATPLTAQTQDWDEYTGQFQAVETVEIRPRVAGYIQSIEFEEGSLVSAGDVLYRIDPRPFEAALAQAEAQLATAEAQKGLAEVNNKRATQLLERRVGTEAAADETAAQLAQAVASAQLAKAQIQAAELNLDFATITAPITGRVSATNVDVGSLVSQESTTALTNIVSLDPIEFRFTASEAAYLKYTRLDQSERRPSSRDTRNEVRIKLADEDNWRRKGYMAFVDNQLNPNAGTIEGKAIVENDDLVLVPGIFGRLRLIGSAKYEALYIPDAAIVSDQSNKIVYVIKDDNTVEQRQITLGPLQSGLRVVRDGLTAQDRVVVRGLQRARPGSPVTPEEVQLEFKENGDTIGGPETTGADVSENRT